MRDTRPTVRRSMDLRRILPDLGARTLVVGILNVTPDSFSDGGLHAAPEDALAAARAMKAAGADLIDVGGESTRPGAASVGAEIERARVVPVIEALSKEELGPISIDTTKSEVAQAALRAGAVIVNDVSGGTFDPAILEVSSAMILMHTRARPDAMQRGQWCYEGGVVAAVSEFLEQRIAAAVGAGISREALIVDPGIGFGKTLDENLALIDGLSALSRLGVPIMIGTSRKSFLGKITAREVGERVHGTAASVAIAIARGADLVRVHDVEAMVDVVRVADAIVRRG